MSAAKRGGLGQGLGALFGDMDISVQTGQGPDGSEQVLLLDINNIKPNAKQPRKAFDDEKIQELADSIKEHGVLQPVLVRASGQGYELVAGERRWRAARVAGLKEIPCLLRELTEEQNLLVTLIENVQREDLNTMEEAEAIYEMVSAFGMTQAQVAKGIGKSRPYVTNALRLLKLPEEIRQFVSSEALSGGHARALASISDEKRQMEGARRAVREGWSVRDMEAFAAAASEKKDASGKKTSRKKGQAPSGEIQALEGDLRDILGTKVHIHHGARGGNIVIEYYSRDELERLLEVFQSLRK